MSNSTPTITHPSSKTVVSEVKYLGFTLQVYRRNGTGKLWYRGTIDGRRIRDSTGHEELDAAEQFVTELIEELAERVITKKDLSMGNVTLRQLWSQFRLDQLPEYGKQERMRVRGPMERMIQFWGDGKLIHDIDRHDVQRYTSHRISHDGVKSVTVRQDMKILTRICNWAVDRKINGRALLEENAINMNWVPKDGKKTRRPLCRHPRFLNLLRFARHQGRYHPGYFLTMLVLARYTGRRRGSILHLRYCDLLLEPTAIQEAVDTLLDREILDEEAAEIYRNEAPELWKHGAIRWEPEFDKENLETWIVPLHPVASKALRNHLSRHPGDGENFIFASRNQLRSGAPISEKTAGNWFRQAEQAARDAGLDMRNREQDGWHALRRAWRTELPDYVNRKAAAKVGGWKWQGVVSPKFDRRNDGVSEIMDRDYLRVLPGKEFRVVTSHPACRAGADTESVTARSIKNMDPLEAKRFLLDLLG